MFFCDLAAIYQQFVAAFTKRKNIHNQFRKKEGVKFAWSPCMQRFPYYCDD